MRRALGTLCWAGRKDVWAGRMMCEMGGTICIKFGGGKVTRRVWGKMIPNRVLCLLGIEIAY